MQSTVLHPIRGVSGLCCRIPGETARNILELVVKGSREMHTNTSSKARTVTTGTCMSSSSTYQQNSHLRVQRGRVKQQSRKMRQPTSRPYSQMDCFGFIKDAHAESGMETTRPFRILPLHVLANGCTLLVHGAIEQSNSACRMYVITIMLSL